MICPAEREQIEPSHSFPYHMIIHTRKQFDRLAPASFDNRIIQYKAFFPFFIGQRSDHGNYLRGQKRDKAAPIIMAVIQKAIVCVLGARAIMLL